jgi:CheY-like chemotaxis protein
MEAKTKILVVEDDRNIQTILRMVLEKAGYQVVLAVDGIQGTMMARTAQPQLIVLDIMMPGGSGFTVFERLRQMTGTMSIPVLIYSAVPTDQILEKIQMGPGVRLLQKPAAPSAFLEAVQGLLAGD